MTFFEAKEIVIARYRARGFIVDRVVASNCGTTLTVYFKKNARNYGHYGPFGCAKRVICWPKDSEQKNAPTSATTPKTEADFVGQLSIFQEMRTKSTPKTSKGKTHAKTY